MRKGGGECLGKDGAYFKDEFKEKLSGVLEAGLSEEDTVGFKEDTRRYLEDSCNQNSLPVESLLCAGLSKQAVRMTTILLSPHRHSMR